MPQQDGWTIQGPGGESVAPVAPAAPASTTSDGWTIAGPQATAPPAAGAARPQFPLVGAPPVRVDEQPHPRDQFNTPIPPNRQADYQDWLDQEKQKLGRDVSADHEDYDITGAFLAGAGSDDDRGHFPDTFKKPNHPTFSTESKYSGQPGGPVGGRWVEKDGQQYFYASPDNLKYRTAPELERYFNQYEPDVTLVLPKQAQPQSIVPTGVPGIPGGVPPGPPAPPQANVQPVAFARQYGVNEQTPAFTAGEGPGLPEAEQNFQVSQDALKTWWTGTNPKLASMLTVNPDDSKAEKIGKPVVQTIMGLTSGQNQALLLGGGAAGAEAAAAKSAMVQGTYAALDGILSTYFTYKALRGGGERAVQAGYSAFKDHDYAAAFGQVLGAGADSFMAFLGSKTAADRLEGLVNLGQLRAALQDRLNAQEQARQAQERMTRTGGRQIEAPAQETAAGSTTTPDGWTISPEEAESFRQAAVSPEQPPAVPSSGRVAEAREQAIRARPEPASPPIESTPAASSPEPENGGVSEHQEASADRTAGSVAPKNSAPTAAATVPAEERGPGWLGYVPTSEIQVDAPRFQFKRDVGQGGAGEKLREVQTYDPDKAGVLQVWKDPEDGQTYIVNGHHRLELAQRTGAPQVAVRYIDAPDAAKARLKGAISNIAEDQGTSIDAAKVFRETGMTPEQAQADGLAIKGKIASEGLALSRLSQPIFDDVIQGDLSPARGAVIGAGVPNHADQQALYDLIEQREKSGKRLTNDQIGELIRLNNRTSTVTESSDAGGQAGLFGAEEMTRSLLPEKAEVSDYVRAQLRGEKRLFGAVSTQAAADRLAEAGNVVRTDENLSRAVHANQGIALYDKLSTAAGPIDSVLDQSARRLADGENANEVKRDAYRQIRDHLSQQLRQLTGVSEGTGPAPQGLRAGRSDEAGAGQPHQVDAGGTGGHDTGAEGALPSELDPLQQASLRHREAREMRRAKLQPGKKLTPYDTPEIIAARARSAAMQPTAAIRTPQREALRKHIEDQLFRPEGVDKGKQAYLVMGPPAAGKSTIAEPLAKETHSLMIDSDHAKELLPEFDNGQGAMATHQESSDIARKLFDRAIAQGLNIVHPLVGKTLENVRGLRDDLRANGYQVHLIHVDLPIEKAARRAVDRFQQTGRFVDPWYLLHEVKDLPKRNYDILKSEGGKAHEAAPNFQAALVEGARQGSLRSGGKGHRGVAPQAPGAEGSGSSRQGTEGELASHAEFSNDVPRGEAPKFIEGQNFQALRSLRSRGAQQHTVRTGTPSTSASPGTPETGRGNPAGSSSKQVTPPKKPGPFGSERGSFSSKPTDQQTSLVSPTEELKAKAAVAAAERKLLHDQLTAQLKSGGRVKEAKLKPAENRGLFDEEQPEQGGLFGSERGSFSLKPSLRHSKTLSEQGPKHEENLRAWYTGQRDRWAAAVNQELAKLRKVLPDPIDQEALAIYRDFKNRPGELKQWLTGTHAGYGEVRDLDKARDAIEKLRAPIERAMNPTPAMKQADQVLTRIAEASLREGQRLGFIDKHVKPEEYVTHLLSRDQEEHNPTLSERVGQAVGGKIGRNFPYNQQREFPTLLEAAANGFKPRALNAFTAFEMYGDKFATARATHQLIERLRATDLGVWGSRGSKNVPQGWVEIAPHAHPFRNLVTDTEGNPAYQTLYVPPFVEKALQPVTDPNYMSRVRGFRALRAIQQSTKSAQLGFSFFHAVTENYMAAFSMGPRGYLQTLAKDQRFAPEFLTEERDFIGHGGTTDIQHKLLEGYRAASRSALPTWREAWRNAAGIRQIDRVGEAISRLTFGNLQRRFKVANYSLEKAAWLAAHPDATEEARNEALRSIAKTVNAVYGGLHWENLGVNAPTLQVARALLLAPDWTFSNFYNARYAFEHGTPAGSMARKFWLRAIVGGLVATQLASLMLSGKKSKRPTQVYMGTDKEGKEIYQNLFFKGAPGDLFNFVGNVWDYGAGVGLIRTTSNKASPVLRAGLDQIKGQTFLGHEIAPKGMHPVASTVRSGLQLAKDLAPIPWSAINTLDMLFGPDAGKYKIPLEVLTTLFAGTPPTHVKPKAEKSEQGIWEQIRTGKVSAPSSRPLPLHPERRRAAR